MISIIGFIIVIVTAVFAYRTAKEYGRNAVGWTFAVIGAGLGIQLVIPVLIGIVIAVVMIFGGSTEEEIQAAIIIPAAIISVICVFLSIIAIMLILRFLATVPDDETFAQPPSPPDF